MGVCVDYQSHSETAVSLSVTCWERNQLPSQGLCVLKARMRGTVELCQYFSAGGSIALQRAPWKLVGGFYVISLFGLCRFQLCQTFCSFRTVLPNKEFTYVLHVFRMTQWAFLKDVRYKRVPHLCLS